MIATDNVQASLGIKSDDGKEIDPALLRLYFAFLQVYYRAAKVNTIHHRCEWCD